MIAKINARRDACRMSETDFDDAIDDAIADGQAQEFDDFVTELFDEEEEE